MKIYNQKYKKPFHLIQKEAIISIKMQFLCCVVRVDFRVTDVMQKSNAKKMQSLINIFYLVNKFQVHLNIIRTD
jgi:hypothetical protein